MWPIAPVSTCKCQLSCAVCLLPFTEVGSPTRSSAARACRASLCFSISNEKSAWIQNPISWEYNCLAREGGTPSSEVRCCIPTPKDPILCRALLSAWWDLRVCLHLPTCIPKINVKKKTNQQNTQSSHCQWREASTSGGQFISPVFLVGNKRPLEMPISVHGPGGSPRQPTPALTSNF